MAYRKNKITGQKGEEYGYTKFFGYATNDLRYDSYKTNFLSGNIKRDEDGYPKHTELKIENFSKGHSASPILGSKYETTLTFAEQRSAIAKAKGDYRRFSNTFKDIKASKGARSMVMQAFRQLEYINSAAAKASENYRKNINNTFNIINEPQEEPIDLGRLDYVDLEGQERSFKLGINKDKFGRKQYYEFKRVEEPQRDSAGQIVRDNSGNAIVKEEEKWVQIRESEFYEKVGLAYRSNIKAERGMTRSLFELSDREGNKLIITDARDDDEKENSYQDNTAPLNFYQRDRSGSQQQLSGKELASVIETSGVSELEIKMKQFGGTLAHVSGKVGGALAREGLHIAGRQISDYLRQPVEFR